MRIILITTMLLRFHQHSGGETSVIVAYSRTVVRQLAKEKREKEERRQRERTRKKENRDEREKE